MTADFNPAMNGHKTVPSLVKYENSDGSIRTAMVIEASEPLAEGELHLMVLAPHAGAYPRLNVPMGPGPRTWTP